MANKKSPKVATFKHSCINCDYFTNKKTDFDKHLSTVKHARLKTTNICLQNVAKSLPQHSCECGKIYKHVSSLYKHKKHCLNISNNSELNSEFKQQQLIEYLLKENAEFKQLMIEQNKQMLQLAQNSGNNNNNNTTNSNNTSFNLQFFLNETCKNAMNIMDFVNQLQVSINDLEETGRLGFAQGISNIFINGLKQIDVSDRPIHCSDSKRETLYIKNNDQWNKETEDKTVLTNAIKHVAHKNMKQISEWQKIHPEYNDSDSKQNDKYLKIVSESMSGSSKEESNKNYEKIAKNIAKEVIIEK